MSKQVNALEDVVPHARKLLEETLALIETVQSAQPWLQPFTNSIAAQFNTMPQYIVSCKTQLAELPIRKFQINYPTVLETINNGSSDDEGRTRLHDGIYKLGQLNSKLTALKFMVKLDDDQEELLALTNRIVGDLVIYVITQFELDKYDSGVFLSVSEHCDATGRTPAVFYGELISALDQSGEWPYGYESISEFRDELLDIDAVFVAECEENNFPLDVELCKKIIGGKLTIPAARLLLIEHMKQSEENDVEGMTPANMVSRMNLS